MFCRMKPLCTRLHPRIDVALRNVVGKKVQFQLHDDTFSLVYHFAQVCVGKRLCERCLAA